MNIPMEKIENGDAIHWAERESQPVTINVDQDKGWMESLGCEWPAGGESSEAEWLEHVNQSVLIGSQPLVRGHRTRQFGEEREPIIEARREFFELFKELGPDFFNNIRRSADDGWNAYSGTALDNFVDTQRFLFAKGVKMEKILARSPSISTYSAVAVRERFEFLDEIGLTTDRMAPNIQSNSVFSLSRGSILERLAPMYAAARAAGVDDSRAWANRLVQEWPHVISYRPDKTRLMARIAMTAVRRPEFTDLSLGQVASSYIVPIESWMVAYLRHQGESERLSPFLSRVAHYGNKSVRHDPSGLVGDKDAQIGYVLEHRGDPIVEAYLRSYPIDNPEQEEYLRLRHVRARDRHVSDYDYPLLWEGPSLLGDPSMPVASMLREASRSTQLSEDDLAELRMFVKAGDKAFDELIRTDVRHTEDHGESLVAAMAKGGRARRAQIARHLGMVMDIAETTNATIRSEEAVSLGNFALSRFGMEVYRPELVPDDVPYRDLAALSIMRMLIGHTPHLDGIDRSKLEKQYGDLLDDLMLEAERRAAES